MRLKTLLAALAAVSIVDALQACVRLHAREVRGRKILKSPEFARLALAAAVVSGSIIGGASSSRVGKTAVVRGRGPLVRVGCRLDPLSLFAGAWAVFGVLSMMPFDRRFTRPCRRAARGCQDAGAGL
jgi:hypothetical protein